MIDTKSWTKEDLTLTNVVFEFWIVIISLYLIYYLTLTNVVFEFTL